MRAIDGYELWWAGFYAGVIVTALVVYLFHVYSVTHQPEPEQTCVDESGHFERECPRYE